jgi:O-antigen/teichoic acid export membrane protein
MLQLGGGRFIAFARTLVLARLLAPDDFGLLAIGWLTLEVLMAVTEFGMRPAIIQQPDLEERDCDTAWTFDLVRASVVVGVVLLAAPFIAGLFRDPRAANVIRIMALTQIVDAFESIGVPRLARDLRFRPQAAIGITGALVNTAVAIALAPSIGVWAIVAGLVTGSVAQTATSYVVAPHRPRLRFDPPVARRLFRFGRWFFVIETTAVLGSAALQLVVSRELGTAMLGLYFLSTRLAFLPKELLRNVLGGVMFPVHARLQSDATRAGRALRASVVGVLMVLAPGYALLMVLAPSLVADLLGARWAGAAPVLRVLAVAGMIGGLADTTIPMLQGRGRPQGAAVLYMIRSGVVLAVAWLLAGRYEVVGAAAAWLLAEASVLVSCVIVTVRVLDRPFAGLAAGGAAILAAAAGGALAAFGVDSLVTGPAGVILAAAAGGALAGIILWRLDRSMRLGLAADLLQAFPQVAAGLKRLGVAPYWDEPQG